MAGVCPPQRVIRMMKRKILVSIVLLTLAVFLLAGCGGSAEEASSAAVPDEPVAEEPEAEEAEEEAEQPGPVVNPLTGLEGYRQEAVGKRPVAIVVENDPKARPQWGIDDPKQAPDIIVEGEMEGGETRTLWIYADMGSVPTQVGPTRSARPPYVRFSELFDAVFIHCGLSHTQPDYVGADTVFEQDGVDHINMLSYGGSVKLFGRDYSRTSMLEHTAYVDGSKIIDACKQQGFRTKLNESHFTTFSFVKEEAPIEKKEGMASEAEYMIAEQLAAKAKEEEQPKGKACKTIDCTFSSATATRHWEYSSEDEMYHTQDYYTDVARTNVLVLFDTTKYITKQVTGDTYTDYLYEGGAGKYASKGRVQDITWKVKDGKLVLLDKDGAPLELEPGRTFIGLGSTNHGGHADVSK